MSRYSDRVKREAEELAARQKAEAEMKQALGHGVLPPQVREVKHVAQEVGQAAGQIAQHTGGLTVIAVRRGADLILVAGDPSGQQPASAEIQRSLVKALDMTIPQPQPTLVTPVGGTPA